MSFFPLFCAATHVLRLDTDPEYRTITVQVFVEQSDVDPETGVLNAPTRTIFNRSSIPLHTDRIPGFRCQASRDWIGKCLKDTSARATYLPPSTTAAINTPAWDVAILSGLEGTMLVKETRQQQQQQPKKKLVGDIPITLRAQIIGETETGESHLIAESGSMEISAARILFVRKVIGIVLHTTAGDVGVVVSVAREDSNGCQRRVEDFLRTHSSLPASNVSGVAQNLIKAASNDEIMVFCQLRKKFGLTDFSGRLTRFMSLYALDEPENLEEPDNEYAAALLQNQWSPTEEVLFVTLSTLFGPEQDMLSSWVRFRALNSVIPETITDTAAYKKDMYKRWVIDLRKKLSQISSSQAQLSSSSSSATAAAGGGGGGATGGDTITAADHQHFNDSQNVLHKFFQYCTDEITNCQEDHSNTFREPPPFLYLYDNEVREMLHIDSFGGFSQSLIPGIDFPEAIQNKDDSSSSSSDPLSFEDQLSGVSVRKARNAGGMLIDVVTEGTQTSINSNTVQSQCNFFEKPETFDVTTQAREFKLTSEETVQTNSDAFYRSNITQTDPPTPTPTADAQIDATEQAVKVQRETQTLDLNLLFPKRNVKLSTVDDYPSRKFGFEDEILARDGDLRRQLESQLEEHINARKQGEAALKVADESTELARQKLKLEVLARQSLEKELDAIKDDLADKNKTVSRLTTQARLVEIERKEMESKKEESKAAFEVLTEQLEDIRKEKKEAEDKIQSQIIREEELTAELANVTGNYESMKRQCEILSEDAKVSRENAEKVYKQMKELEDQLLQEKDERAKLQEKVELAERSDVMAGIASSDTMVNKLRSLEQERDSLIRERDQMFALGYSASAGSGGSPSSSAAAAAAAAGAQHQDEQNILSRVSQAKDRIQRYRDEKEANNRIGVPHSYLDSSADPNSPNNNNYYCPPRMTGNNNSAGRRRGGRLPSPSLPSRTAPVLIIDEDHEHLAMGSLSERHALYTGHQQHYDEQESSSRKKDKLQPLAKSTVRFTPETAAAIARVNNAASGAGAAGSSEADFFSHQNSTSSSTTNPRQLIEDGWQQQRRGLTDAARTLWEKVANSSSTISTRQASEPSFLGARYEAAGLLSEFIHHDPVSAAENYSMAIKYWPNMTVILRLAALHDREENGDPDVAIDLYRLAASMGSQTAKARVAEILSS